MSNCPFYNEEMISSYVENLLDDNESGIFEKHLMECDICLQSVLDLRNDLFKMELYDRQFYKGTYIIEAVFLMIKNRLLILRDIGRISHFRRLKGDFKLKGNDDNDSYKVEIGNINIVVEKDTEEKFRIELVNIEGKFVKLLKGERLVEARSASHKNRLILRELDRGEYVVVISDGKEYKDGERDKRIKIKVN